jgi:hypothetical protein
VNPLKPLFAGYWFKRVKIKVLKIDSLKFVLTKVAPLKSASSKVQSFRGLDFLLVDD